jgi:hypothetical protein
LHLAGSEAGDAYFTLVNCFPEGANSAETTSTGALAGPKDHHQFAFGIPTPVLNLIGTKTYLFVE